MKTDINRLHDVIERRPQGRGAGKTFAMCHLLAGEIELGDSRDMICVISHAHDIDYLFPMLVAVLQEHELPRISSIPMRREIYCAGKKIIFVPRDRIAEYVFGRHRTPVWDFTHRHDFSYVLEVEMGVPYRRPRLRMRDCHA